MIRTLSLCLAALLAASTARADEVRLKNGDRVTGVTTALAGGVLTFKALNGELKIPWANVASLAIVAPMLVTVRNSPTSRPSSSPRMKPGA